RFEKGKKRTRNPLRQAKILWVLYDVQWAMLVGVIRRLIDFHRYWCVVYCHVSIGMGSPNPAASLGNFKSLNGGNNTPDPSSENQCD
ncbi:hypothetical protein COCCADRAFT_89281, partial [Bipolaris zeicola 26-R-13]